MAEDRSWMYTGRQSWSTITPEWADKTTEFVERAFRRVPPGGGLPCPCASCRCRNRLPRSKFDMQIHLGRNGFQPDYTVWPSDSDDQPEDVEVAGSGEEAPKPQGAKKREITVLHAYASSKLRKEQRIEWEHEHQRYMCEKEKLQQQQQQQQQQQSAPKRLAIRRSPPPTPLPSLQFTEVARFNKTDQHAGKGSATIAEDRSWMYTGRQSWSTITPEWADKTTEFVERAFRRVPPGSGLPCPCARCRCRNRLPRSKFDMQIHLGRNGFQPDYTVWPSDSDDQPEDVEVAGSGEEAPKPQGAKKREITVLHVYASSKLRKEQRIEWEHEHQRYMWEKEKLQQQQSAPKRLRTSGAPTAELAEDDEDKDANSCASSSGSI